MTTTPLWITLAAALLAVPGATASTTPALHIDLLQDQAAYPAAPGCKVSYGNCTGGNCYASIVSACNGACTITVVGHCSDVCDLNVLGVCHGNCAVNVVSACGPGDSCSVKLAGACVPMTAKAGAFESSCQVELASRCLLHVGSGGQNYGCAVNVGDESDPLHVNALC